MMLWQADNDSNKWQALALVLLVALHQVLQTLRSIIKRQDMRNRAGAE